MGNAGVRDPRHIVDFRQLAPLNLVPGHDLAIAVAHDFHVHPLVTRVGVTIVSPEERADAHVFPGGRERFPALRGDAHDLLGTQLIGVLVAQFMIGEGLKGDAAALGILADQHRQTAQAVPGGQNSVGCENQNGHGTFNLLLGITDTGNQVVLLVNQGGHQLRGVDLAGAHGHELVAVVGKVPLYQLFGVLNDAHGRDGVQPQMGAHQQGLGIRIADAADARPPVERGKILLELGAEGGVFNVVDLPVETLLPIVDGHAAPASAQVGVVVRAEEHIQHHVPLGNRTKKTAH